MPSAGPRPAHSGSPAKPKPCGAGWTTTATRFPIRADPARRRGRRKLCRYRARPVARDGVPVPGRRTAEEALQLAREYKPSAVVLDIGLPDQSGLAVLDRLKRDVATRHIPVHVVSASDHSQTALSLGAIGYLVKPVKREDLADVLEALAEKLARTVRRVLIVEDDPVQLDAVRSLLASGDVETVGAGTAAECLDLLQRETFDCMVLDLTLPDALGLRRCSRSCSEDGAHSFPPVIVYTGHDLSADDEQRLRRYSDSIIIKGARSPERCSTRSRCSCTRW